MRDSNVLIIGGGISGLSTAWWLAEGGAQVELWDASSRLGGKINTHRESGYITEDAAGILMNFQNEVDQLIRLAGLMNCKQSRGNDIRRYVVHQGRLRPVPMKMPALLFSTLWNLAGKLRMASEILIPKGGHERETVAEFIRRRLGSEILDKVMDPYITGTLASDPERTNAWSVLPRLTRLEQRYGSFTAGMLANRMLHKRRANMAEAFSFEAGMDSLPGCMGCHPGIVSRTGHQALCIESAAKGWRVSASTAAGEVHRHVDEVVLSTPAGVAAELLAPLDSALAGLLRPIEYAPLSVLHLGFARHQIDHPLDGTGFLSPRQEQISFNGNLWMSSLFAGRAPRDRVLLTSYIGGARHPEFCGLTEDALVSRTLADLRPLIGVSGDPEYVRCVRHPAALPLYHGHYFERVRSIKAQLEKHSGIHLAGNYLEGVSVRDRIVQGKSIADSILRHIDLGSPVDSTLSTHAAAG